MKTTVPIGSMIVLAILLLVVPGQAGNSFKLYGQIANLDSESGILQVVVNAPDSLKSSSPLTVQTSKVTEIKECEESSSPSPIKYGGLKVGRMVKITGEMDGEQYVAVRIIQY